MSEDQYENSMRLLDFIASHTREVGYAPTTREMAEALGFRSVESIHRLLTHLRDEGRVIWIPNKARTVRIVQ